MALEIIKGYHIDRTGIIQVGDLDLSNWFKCKPFATRCSYNICESEEQIRDFVAECLPSGLSSYGFHRIDAQFDTMPDWQSLAHELIFEMVRLQFCPNKPSRFSCLYACPKEKLDQHFAILNAAAYPSVQVAEVCLPEDENKYHKGDICWLENIKSVVGGFYNARHYWEGHPRLNPPYFNSPAWEYLLAGSVKVNRLLPPEEIQHIRNNYPAK